MSVTSGWRTHWPGCAIHSRQNGFTLAGWQAEAGSLSAAGTLVSESSVEAELRAFRTNDTPLALLLALLPNVPLATATDVAPLAATAAALSRVSLLCVLKGTAAESAAEAGRAAEVAAGSGADATADAEAGLAAGTGGAAGTQIGCLLMPWLLLTLLVGTCMQADNSACMAGVLPVLALFGLALGSGGAYTTGGRCTA